MNKYIRTSCVFVIELLFLLLFLSLSCTKTPTASQKAKEIYADSLEYSPGNLAFWLQKELAEIDPLMTYALDSIYQHETPAFGSPLDLEIMEAELEWYWATSDYILSLYGMPTTIDDTQRIIFFEELLSKARTTWRLDSGEGGTMGTISNDIIDYHLTSFQTYMYIQSILNASNEDATGQRQKLLQEYIASDLFRDAVYQFITSIYDLMYWGGSIRGIIRSGCFLGLKQAQMELYAQEAKNPLELVRHSSAQSLEGYRTAFENNSKMMLEQIKQEDTSYFFEEYTNAAEQLKIYKEAIAEAEKAQERIIETSFAPMGFISYRNDRTTEYVLGQGEIFVKANESRTLEFLKKLCPIVSDNP